MLTRRIFVAGSAAALAGTARTSPYSARLAPAVELREGRTVKVELDAAQRTTSLPCFAGPSLPMWTYQAGTWPPVIRLQLGDRLEATLRNSLPRPAEHTSIHWHGIRLPNDQDGVPYLVQDPVRPGESARYAFTPPDAGTFFFHSHCNGAEQQGRGLQGILVVEGDALQPYDADIVLLLRDWHVRAGADQFETFSSLRFAARAGTYGSLRSTNGQVNPLVTLPAQGDCRLRLVNTDPTRIMRLRIEGAEAAIVAIDGIAVPPLPLRDWLLAPAMRCDVVVRAPSEGSIARLVDTSGDAHVELARLAGAGPARSVGTFDPAPLRAPRIPAPDLEKAQALVVRLQANDRKVAVSVQGDPNAPPVGDLCLSSNTFWSINGSAWPDREHPRLPPPLAVLERGRTYLFKLRNESVFAHPIHIHGHTFSVLRSNKQDLPPHHADTVLLLPEEEADVAFVADNPGNWMLHCHVIEHQETGMMTYFRVA